MSLNEIQYIYGQKWCQMSVNKSRLITIKCFQLTAQIGQRQWRNKVTFCWSTMSWGRLLNTSSTAWVHYSWISTSMIKFMGGTTRMFELKWCQDSSYLNSKFIKSVLINAIIRKLVQKSWPWIKFFVSFVIPINSSMDIPQPWLHLMSPSDHMTR